MLSSTKLTRKEPPRAGKNNDLDRRIFGSCGELGQELSQELSGKGIAFLGPVECDDSDTTDGGRGLDEFSEGRRRSGHSDEIADQSALAGNLVE